VLFFVAVMQCAVVNNRAIAWYQNWYRHFMILGGIMAPRFIVLYRDLFDTGIETSILTILIKVSKVSHSTTVEL